MWGVGSSSWFSPGRWRLSPSRRPARPRLRWRGPVPPGAGRTGRSAAGWRWGGASVSTGLPQRHPTSSIGGIGRNQRRSTRPRGGRRVRLCRGYNTSQGRSRLPLLQRFPRSPRGERTVPTLLETARTLATASAVEDSSPRPTSIWESTDSMPPVGMTPGSSPHCAAVWRRWSGTSSAARRAFSRPGRARMPRPDAGVKVAVRFSEGADTVMSVGTACP